MKNFSNNLIELNQRGFSISSPTFGFAEIETISEFLNSQISNNHTEEHAIRHLFKKTPALFQYLLSIPLFNDFIKTSLPAGYFLTKSIYFNKPSNSNWFVSYHQDLSISVKNKVPSEGFSNWTIKNHVYGVQPPQDILNNTITMRIHLDDTNKDNGALRVIEKSHTKGIIRVDRNFNALKLGHEEICNVSAGSIMLMSPLTLHASDRSISDKHRRVIHLEFCNKEIPENIGWHERINLN